MKKLSIAIASLAALVSVPAFAADMAVKARPVPVVAPAPYNWSGFYIGFQSGGAIADVNWDYVPGGGTNQDHIASGGLVGGTIGFNYQVASWVLGVEADYAYANIRGSINCPNPGFRCQTELESLGTARLRLGYAVGPMLFYGTGGAAFGNLDVETVNLAGAPTAPSGTATNGTDQFQWGWTAGVGFEYAPLMSNLTWKIEWLYYNLERDIYRVDNGLDVDVRHSGHLIRTGLNYRFNWLAAAPVVMARY